MRFFRETFGISQVRIADKCLPVHIAVAHQPEHDPIKIFLAALARLAVKTFLILRFKFEATQRETQ